MIIHLIFVVITYIALTILSVNADIIFNCTGLADYLCVITIKNSLDANIAPGLNSQYRGDTRPTIAPENSMNISSCVEFKSLDGIEETVGGFTATVILTLQWYDELLTIDHMSYSTISTTIRELLRDFKVATSQGIVYALYSLYLLIGRYFNV